MTPLRISTDKYSVVWLETIMHCVYLIQHIHMENQDIYDIYNDDAYYGDKPL